MPAYPRRYMVVKASQRDLPSLQAGDRELAFGKSGMEIVDPGVAHEIEDRYGVKGTGDVVVVPHYVDREPGHHYTFSVPELPWKRKKEGV